MKCPKPIQTETKGSFPCGQCISCRINKKRIWAGRVVQEWAFHPVQSYFCTLTYNDEHLPHPEILNDQGKPSGALDKPRFVQWLKDVQKTHRHRANPGRFRYYAVGEYGEKSRRAHYHMALFPEHPSQVVALQSRWEDRGFFSFSPINHERARYLANYVTKKLTGPGADAHEVYRSAPEFRISSRSPPLGAAFVEAVIRKYQAPRGQALIAERGDIDRTFRLDGYVYPFGQWALTKMRESLGIPLLHRERIAHPNYLHYFPQEEPEWDESMARYIEVKHGKTSERQRKLAKPYIQV